MTRPLLCVALILLVAQQKQKDELSLRQMATLSAKAFDTAETRLVFLQTQIEDISSPTQVVSAINLITKSGLPATELGILARSLIGPLKKISSEPRSFANSFVYLSRSLGGFVGFLKANGASARRQ
jgi:hypothetical protein